MATHVDDRKFHIGYEFVSENERCFVLRFCGIKIGECLSVAEAESLQLDQITLIVNNTALPIIMQANALDIIIQFRSVMWLKTPNSSKYAVCYGAQMKQFTRSDDACIEFSQYLLHQLQCDGVC